MCALLGKLVRISQIKITYFTGLSLYDRVLRELEKQFLPEREHHLRSRIRYVLLVTSFLHPNSSPKELLLYLMQYLQSTILSPELRS